MSGKEEEENRKEAKSYWKRFGSALSTHLSWTFSHILNVQKIEKIFLILYHLLYLKVLGMVVLVCWVPHD